MRKEHRPCRVGVGDATPSPCSFGQPLARGRAEAKPEGRSLAGEGGGQACALPGLASACQERQTTAQHVAGLGV